MRRRLAVPLLVAACMLTLTVIAQAATLVAIVGHRERLVNHFGDAARGQMLCYAEGQIFDANDNGVSDSLRGKVHCHEKNKVLRIALGTGTMKVQLGDGSWVDVPGMVAEGNNSDGRQPAAVSQWTPLLAFCPHNTLTRVYKMQGLAAVRWDDNLFTGSLAIHGALFRTRMLANDPDCLPPGPPPPAADLDVSIADSPDPVLNGQPLTVTVPATNAGTATANGARLTIDVDDRLGGLSSVEPAGVVCDDAADLDPGAGVDNAVVCDLGSLSAGEEVIVRVTGTPSAAGTYTTVATLSSTTPGVASATDTETTTVVAAADLRLVKTAAPTASTTDDPNLWVFTFATSNGGPNANPSFTVVDEWPAHLADPTVVPAGCTFDDPGDRLVCVGAGPAVSGTVSFAVTAPILASGTNTATVDGDLADPDPSNNTDSADVTFTPAPVAA